MVEMATEFKRSGFSDEDAAILAQTASLYQNIADEELSASDASAVLISQMKAFRFEANQAEHVIDSINEVANKNAVSSGDIGRGLTQAGAALSTYGNTFEETIGLITAGTEIFQGRSQQVARGLNTVASRIAKNEKALKEYGVEIYDENNELKSTYDILSELAPEWEKMTKAQKVALGTTLAGVNQYKVFSAVMTNFDTAVKASKEALDSEGSALKENEKYMESIQARIQAVKNELQEMILNSNLQSLVKGFLAIAEAVLKIQNLIGGLPPLLTAIGGILLTFNIDKILAGGNKLKAIFASINDIANAFSNLGKNIKIVTTYLQQQKSKTDEVTIATDGATVSANAYDVALTSLEAAMSAVVAVATILVSVLSMVIAKEKEREQEQLQNLNTFSEYVKKTNEAIETLQNEKITRNELNNVIESNFDEYDAEYLKLLDVNAAREKSIELLEKEKQKRVKEVIETGQSSYEQALERKYANQMTGVTGLWTTALAYWNTPEEFDYSYAFNGLDKFKEKLLESKHELEKQRAELKTTSKTYKATFKALSTGIDGYERALQVVNKQLDKDEETIKKFEEALLAQGKAYDYVNKRIISLENAKKKALKGGKNSYTESVKEDLDSLQEVFDATDEQIQQVRDKLYQDIAEGDSEATVFSVFAELFPELAGEAENLDDSLENLRESLGATDEELERAQGFLNELGIKENVLEKEIGMTSIELLRQADAWNMDGQALYKYLTALNRFDDSMDNIQSSYQTLQTALDEYNEMQGFSIDTTQALLKLSPEYLEILDEAISGNKSLSESITEKVKCQAFEAKQQIYKIAIDRINKLGTEENTEATKKHSDKIIINTKNIDAQTAALDKNSKAKIVNAQASAKQRGATDEDIKQILDDMERQLDAVDKMVLATSKDFSAAMGNNSKSANGTNSALKEQNQLLKEQKQLLEEKKKQYDTVVSYIKKKIQGEIDKLKDEKKAQVDAIKDQIDALKDLKEAESDAIDEQIDKLKEQKEIEEEYWSEKIEAFKKQNEELNDQLELQELLENLAKAKSKRVRVYKEGQGFVYTEDSNEIDKAQTKLDEYTRKKNYEDQLELLESYKKNASKNYEEQIEALQKLKKEKEKNYDEQIKALEAYQKEVEDNYDAQIAYFQAYLDKFTEQTDAYENEQNRLLALQLTGIDFEQQGWQTRLDNLANFVEQYNALLGDIHTLDGDGTVSATGTVGSGGGGNGSGNKGNQYGTSTEKTSNSIASVTKALGGSEKASDFYATNYGGKKESTTTTVSPAYHATGSANANYALINGHSVGGVAKKASGDSSIDKDGMYLVGDSPNQELLIGSKLNGSLMNLTKGTGVVNSESTRTLAGMLNQFGLMGNQGINMSNTQTRSTNISIGNISLPSVQNGQDFVDYLQNFSLQMTQSAFA